MLGSMEAGIHGTIEFRILTEDKFDSALEVQQKSMHQECIARGIGLYEEEGAPEATKILFQEVIKDGYTIAAVQKKTEKVVAVSFNKIHLNPDVADDIENAEPIFEVMKNIKPRSVLALIEFLDDIQSKVNIYEKYNVQAAMEIFYIGVDPDYRRYGLGQRIVAESLAFARKLKKENSENKIVPEVAFAIFTSNYSQRIGEIFKFDWLATVQYSDLTYWGKTMAERIGDEHKTAKLGALRL